MRVVGAWSSSNGQTNSDNAPCVWYRLNFILQKKYITLPYGHVSEQKHDGQVRYIFSNIGVQGSVEIATQIYKSDKFLSMFLLTSLCAWSLCLA